MVWVEYAKSSPIVSPASRAAADLRCRQRHRARVDRADAEPHPDRAGCGGAAAVSSEDHGH